MSIVIVVVAVIIVMVGVVVVVVVVFTSLSPVLALLAACNLEVVIIEIFK